MKTISIIGITTTGGTASEVKIENEAPIASILSGELLIALHAHNSFQVLNSEAGGTGSDRTSFVSINDGAGNTLEGHPDIAADGGGTEDYFVTSSSDNATRKPLDVVTGEPTADGEIQLTDVNKFTLFLDTGMTENDTLILKVVAVGEIMRP